MECVPRLVLNILDMIWRTFGQDLSNSVITVKEASTVRMGDYEQQADGNPNGT